MTREEFVEGVRTARDAAVTTTVQALETPTGRRPNPGLVEESKWFLGLSPADRQMVERVLATASHAAVFGALAILYGVRSIEGMGPKTNFRLLAERDGKTTDLTPGTGEMLHDLIWPPANVSSVSPSRS